MSLKHFVDSCLLLHMLCLVSSPPPSHAAILSTGMVILFYLLHFLSTSGAWGLKKRKVTSCNKNTFSGRYNSIYRHICELIHENIDTRYSYLPLEIRVPS